MKRKKTLALCLFVFVFCCGCQRADDKQSLTENVLEKVEIENNEKRGYDFPSVYQDEIENVQFDTEIAVNEAVNKNGLYQTNIKIKDRDYETPWDVVFRDIAIAERNDTEAKPGEKYGRAVFWKGADNRTLYMNNRKLTVATKTSNRLLGAINLEEDEEYNADKYLTGEEFTFMSMDQAYQSILQYMSELGMNMENTDTFGYNCYSLNYKTMEKVERMEEENTPIEYRNPDIVKEPWAEADNAYLFAIHQYCQDCIVQYPAGGIFPEISDINAALIVIITKDGIQRFDACELFEFEQGDEWLDLLSFEDIASHIARKYNMILTDSKYIVKKAELYWRPIEHEDFSFEMIPAWEVTVEETSTGNSRLIYINALNGDEIS